MLRMGATGRMSALAHVATPAAHVGIPAVTIMHHSQMGLSIVLHQRGESQTR